MSKMRDWHRVFVQKLMSEGIMTGTEVFIFVKILAEDYFNGTPGFPTIDFNNEDQASVKNDVADLIEELLATSNAALESNNFQIKKGKEEVKVDDSYQQCYVFVPTEENQQIAKMQKVFTDSELEYFKIIIYHLAENKTATENRLINLCSEGGITSKKKLSPMEAEKAIKNFVHLRYLLHVRKHSRASSKGGTYSLGARAILELESWLVNNVDDVKKCRSCHKPVIVSVECSTSGGNKRCEAVYHKSCAEKCKSKCTVCRSVLKVDGVASKR